ncbi:endonuclease NucS domain-containing protein [Methanospirillum stamsii]|uniref:Endonuclease NucS C-terminal domain-containing protein n=1 Tax=Methanospirillum stamsii TaxID=1277351 RepID=A0A2V2NGW7_9EURY|nr:endonuclease NucS domain-containing protein [Methanospirillum stamsii]PWR74573.1 hypothetical protein DLD82_08285 [Methanospirillum stamsii]
MSHDVRLWKVSPSDGKEIQEIYKSRLNLEERLERWIEEDISIISSGYQIIGRQVETSFGTYVDLLAMDQAGDLVILELKRDKTPRDVVAQTLDYASWVKKLTAEQIIGIAEEYFSKTGAETFEEAFFKKFGTAIPNELNVSHSMLIVASVIDESTERIVSYLSEEHGVPLNVLEFQYFKDNSGVEFLSRVFLIDPDEAESNTDRVSSGKRPKNLSKEELQEIATNNGVGGLYQSLFEGLLPCFDGVKTTRTSIGFIGKNVVGTKTPVTFSLIPLKSSKEKGIRYELYLTRLAEYFHTTIDEIEKILPKSRDIFHYNNDPSPEWSGYQGFFENEDVVRLFLDGVRRMKKKV